MAELITIIGILASVGTIVELSDKAYGKIREGNRSWTSRNAWWAQVAQSAEEYIAILAWLVDFRKAQANGEPPTTDEHCRNMIDRCNKLCHNIQHYHSRWGEKDRSNVLRNFRLYQKRKTHVEGIMRELDAAKVQILIYLQISSLDLQDNQRRDLVGLRQTMEKVLSGIESIQKPPLPPSTPPMNDTKNTRRDTASVAPRPTYNETDTSLRRDKRMFKGIRKFGSSVRKVLPASREQGKTIEAVPAYGDRQSIPPSDITHGGEEASTVSIPPEGSHTISPTISANSTSNDTTENLSDAPTSLAGGSQEIEDKDGEDGADMAWPDESLPGEPAGDSNLESDPLLETCSESSSDDGYGDTNAAIYDDARRRFSEEDNREAAVTEIDGFTDDGEELEDNYPDEDETYDDRSCNDEPNDESRRNSCKLSIWSLSDKSRKIFRHIVDGNDENVPQHLSEGELVDISLLSAVDVRPDDIAKYLANWTEDIHTCFSQLHKKLGTDGLQCAILFCWALGLEDDFRHLTDLAAKAATGPLELLPALIADQMNRRRSEILTELTDAAWLTFKGHLRGIIRACDHLNNDTSLCCTKCQSKNMEDSVNIGLVYRAFYRSELFPELENDDNDSGDHEDEDDSDDYESDDDDNNNIGEVDPYPNVSFFSLGRKLQLMTELSHFHIQRPHPVKDMANLFLGGMMPSFVTNAGTSLVFSESKVRFSNQSKHGLIALWRRINEEDWGLELRNFQDAELEMDVLHRIEERLLDKYPDRRPG